MSFLRGIFITYSNQLVIYVFALISSVLTARGLGPDGRGVLAASMAVFSAVSLIVNFGIGQGLTYTGSKDKQRAARAAFAALTFSVLNGLLGSVVILILHLTGNSAVNNIPETVILMVAAGIPFALLMNYSGGVLLSQNHILAMNSITFMTETIRLIGLTVLYATGIMNIFNVVGLWLINIILTSIFGFTLALTRVGISRALSADILREITTIGFKSFLVGIMGHLLLRSDIIILNMFRVPAEIGYYSIAVTLSDKIVILPKITGRLLFPHSVRGQDEAVPFLMKVSLFTAVTLGLMILLISPVLPFAIRILYGADFSPSTLACYILLPGIYFLGLLNVLMQYFSARGYPPVSFYAPLTALLINVGLNVVLIPAYGYYAAAFTSTVSYAIYYFIFYFKFKSMSGHTLKDLILPGREDIAEIKERISKIRERRRQDRIIIDRGTGDEL